MQGGHRYKKAEFPWNKGSGGCKVGHDSALYVRQTSGVFVCLGCKRQNNALYKKRIRGVLPQFEKKAPVILWCACGCGGHPKKGRFVQGHNKKTSTPADRNLGQRNWRMAIRVLVLGHYGTDGQVACVRCGFSDIRALSIDHIGGNGNSHRKRIKQWLYLWLKREGFPPGYQTLCMNCQMIKASENAERPGGRIPVGFQRGAN